MRIWRTSPKDSILAAISLVHLLALLAMAITWKISPVPVRIFDGFALVALIAYSTVIISHQFIHVPWFVDDRMNALVSVVNSVNIGHSVQTYRFSHVRNHHRYSNDRCGPDGMTRDTSSTYRNGKDGEHEPMLSYVITGTKWAIIDFLKEILSVKRLWRVGSHEKDLLVLASGHEPKRSRELRQIQVDRAAHTVSVLLFLLISWQWTVFCYFPAFAVAMVLANTQNYYRHFGADPDERAANSVSYYGRLYNLLAFNDGYHQEHHLAPGAHWSSLPAVHERHRASLEAQLRIVSPVPAMLGFLHRDRILLHRRADRDVSRAT
jgi:fatty acid desaturase